MPGSSDHLLQVCSGLLARAIAACRLDHDWEQPEQIAVTLRSLDLPQGRQLELTGGQFEQRQELIYVYILTMCCAVSDTGAPIPDDLRVSVLPLSAVSQRWLVIPFLPVQVVKLMFSSILPAEAATLMEGPLTIRTTGGRPAAVHAP